MGFLFRKPGEGFQGCWDSDIDLDLATTPPKPCSHHVCANLLYVHGYVYSVPLGWHRVMINIREGKDGWKQS